MQDAQKCEIPWCKSKATMRVTRADGAVKDYCKAHGEAEAARKIIMEWWP